MAERHAARQLRRGFQGYTTDDAPALIGFGASAIGSLPQGYVQNAADRRRPMARRSSPAAWRRRGASR